MFWATSIHIPLSGIRGDGSHTRNLKGFCSCFLSSGLKSWSGDGIQNMPRPDLPLRCMDSLELEALEKQQVPAGLSALPCLQRAGHKTSKQKSASPPWKKTFLSPDTGLNWNGPSRLTKMTLIFHSVSLSYNYQSLSHNWLPLAQGSVSCHIPSVIILVNRYIVSDPRASPGLHFPSEYTHTHKK